MSSPQTAMQDKSFQDRLNRVAVRRAPVEESRPEIEVLPDWKANVSGPVGLFAAIFVGIVAVLAVRIVRFHLTGAAMVGGNADMTLLIETGAALALSFGIFLLLPYRGYKYKLLQFAGVALMISTMHNFVHSAPGLFSLAFSPEWTAQVTEATEPSTLYLRGESIPFVGQKEEEKPVIPKIRRVG